MPSIALRTNLFVHFRVSVEFTDKLCGGIPKSADLQRKWLESKISDQSVADGIAAKTVEAMGNEAEEYSHNGFMRGSNGNLVFEGRCIKACLKESSGILRDFMGITAFKNRIAERVFVVESQIDLGKPEPDGTYESIVHAMTRQGPISALKRVDFITRPAFSFHLEVLNEPLISKDSEKKNAKKVEPVEYLSAILPLAMREGMGAERSQGFGRFTVTEFVQVDSLPEIGR